MSTRPTAVKGKKPAGKANSPYGYPFWDWVAREDPEYVRARAPLRALSIGEGKELSVGQWQLIALARDMSFADGIDMLMGRGDLPPEFSGALERVRDLPAAVFVIGSLVLSLVIYPIFSMLGALLGVALFRRTPPPPPPGTVEILPPE